MSPVEKIAFVFGLLYLSQQGGSAGYGVGGSSVVRTLRLV
jgi:hypothetical protein